MQILMSAKRDLLKNTCKKYNSIMETIKQKENLLLNSTNF